MNFIQFTKRSFQRDPSSVIIPLTMVPLGYSFTGIVIHNFELWGLCFAFSMGVLVVALSFLLSFIILKFRKKI